MSRIFLLICLNMIGLARLDQSLFPEWINEQRYVDYTNTIYLSMVYLYHCHNHPVAVTAFHLLKREVNCLPKPDAYKIH